jgi:hypothetical protein
MRTTKVEVAGKRAADEVATKVVEEAERKKKEDTLKNYDSPMDINILKMSAGIHLTSCHLPVGEFILELHTPYKPNKVANLKRFRFDKATDIIVQQHYGKLFVTRGNPLSFVTETLVTKDVNKYPLSIESLAQLSPWKRNESSRIFSVKMKKRVLGFKELEEQLRHTKKDKIGLQEFKACALRR